MGATLKIFNRSVCLPKWSHTRRIGINYSCRRLFSFHPSAYWVEEPDFDEEIWALIVFVIVFHGFGTRSKTS